MSQHILVHSSPCPSQGNLLLENTSFPMVSTPPTHPNTDPCCNRLASCPAGLPPAISPLNRDAWASNLEDYPDRKILDTLLNIIDVGASISHMGIQKHQSCKNLRSAVDYPDIISKEIDGLLKEGCIHGPFEAPPMANFRCSPLGTATCKCNPKHCVFNHYSWPRNTSVNDQTPDFEGVIKYDSFISATAALCSAGKGSLMAKLDLKDAYRHIPICSTDWNLLGFQWEGKYYYPLVLMFGGKSAPYIFNLFAEALHWIIEHHLPTSIRHYLDDFLPIFKPNVPAHIACAAVTWIEDLGTSLGLSFQPVKTILPTTCLEFLGLELDSEAMEARLPQDKLIYLHTYILDWQARSSCSLRDLQELIGFLQFCAQVIPHSRTFI